MVTIKLDGLDDLRAALRNLPEDLAHDAAQIVQQAAESTGSDLKEHYPVRSGNLRRGVRVTIESNKAGVSGLVRSSAKHASIFERGTGQRHTNAGWNRGRMPTPPADERLIPRAIRYRQKMVGQLIALVKSYGAEVSE